MSAKTVTSFSISGFRVLADVGPVPLEKPSILTGRNDSGKSSVLDALAFLLDPYRNVLPTDFPIQAEDARKPDEERVIVVTGVFKLNEDDQKATGLADVVIIRRSAGLESNVVTDYGYEAEQQVPASFSRDFPGSCTGQEWSYRKFHFEKTVYPSLR
jgi:predicted ATP-dependent endonuclease of OLD family